MLLALSSDITIRRLTTNKNSIINTEQIKQLCTLDNSIYEIIIAQWQNRVLYINLHSNRPNSNFNSFLIIPDNSLNSAYGSLDLSGRQLETEIFKPVDLDIYSFDLKHNERLIDFLCELNEHLKENRKRIRAIIATHSTNKILFINTYFIDPVSNSLHSCLLFPDTIMDSIVLNSFVDTKLCR